MKLPPDVQAVIDAALAGGAAREVRVRADLLAGGAAPLARLPSPGELAAEAVADWCRKRGYQEPVPEYRFHPTRKFRFDLAWVGQKVAVEFQGGTYGSQGRHVRPKGFEDDCVKFCLAAALGWRVMPVTYRQLNKGLLFDWLAEALA